MPAECNIGEAAGHSITGNLPRSNWMPSDIFFLCVCCFSGGGGWGGVALFFFPGKQSLSSLGAGELQNGISERHAPAGISRGLLCCVLVTSGRSCVLIDGAEFGLLPSACTGQEIQHCMLGLPGRERMGQWEGYPSGSKTIFPFC